MTEFERLISELANFSIEAYREFISYIDDPEDVDDIEEPESSEV